jgi:phage tail sheath gpL-like
MAIDVSAVARVLGIDVQYKDLRGGRILYLPQRVAVLAQGASDVAYSLDKFQATTAGQVGARLGYGSPAHLIARELFPTNGDGVGTIPVTFYPLPNDAAASPASAAEGSIAPLGTPTESGSYRVVVNNIRSDAFAIKKNATVSDACGAIFTAINAVLEMPITAEIAYGTLTSSPGATNVGDGTVTAMSLDGTPASGTYTLTCIAAVLDGGTFSFVGPSGSSIGANITLTPAPGGATVVNRGGLEFTITDGTVDFAVGDSFAITVPATGVDIASKWTGETANALNVAIVGPSVGMTFDVVQPAGGLLNPSVAGALAQFGLVWETMVINALGVDDVDALDLIRDHGEGRWGQTVKKPYVAFVGNTAASVSEATTVSAVRQTDRINAQLVSPGAMDLPFVVAARQVARIVKQANNNPATGYGREAATGLVPGPDSAQWTYPERDLAVKSGSSTIEVKDGVVYSADVVTFYRPTGEEPPAYRYVVDIVKLQNIIFNFTLEFAKPEWKAAPLIPDDQPTVNPNARKPRSAQAAACAILDGLGLEAIIANPKEAKAATLAWIDTMNPKRLDLTTTVQLSGNTEILSVDLAFGFMFGVSVGLAA